MTPGNTRAKAIRAARYRARAFQDTQMEQEAHAETQAAFFLSGAGTSIGVMFVIVAIVASLWVYATALAQTATVPASPSIEKLGQER